MHGGSRKNSGRKKVFSSRKNCRKSWEKGHKRIYLNLNIFDSWKQAKIVAGYEKSSDSDFAAHLLSLEFSFLFVAHELLQLQFNNVNLFQIQQLFSFSAIYNVNICTFLIIFTSLVDASMTSYDMNPSVSDVFRRHNVMRRTDAQRVALLLFKK